MLNNIRIILCQPTHPGNIGACARAMKNMGLSSLTLIEPENYPNAQATERASGADDVLAAAKVVTSLDEAVKDCQWLFGTSGRQRSFPWPQITPNEAALKMMSLLNDTQQIGILFGTERSGLTNEQLQRCDFHIAIPTNPEYPSLNLGAAVQVISYEIFQAWLARCDQNLEQPEFAEKASQEEVAGLLSHFTAVALKLGFMDPKHPKKLIPRVQRLVSKAQLEKDEVNILRGFLKFVDTLKS